MRVAVACLRNSRAWLTIAKNYIRCHSVRPVGRLDYGYIMQQRDISIRRKSVSGAGAGLRECRRVARVYVRAGSPVGGIGRASRSCRTAERGQVWAQNGGAWPVSGAKPCDNLVKIEVEEGRAWLFRVYLRGWCRVLHPLAPRIIPRRWRLVAWSIGAAVGMGDSTPVAAGGQGDPRGAPAPTDGLHKAGIKQTYHIGMNQSTNSDEKE